MSEFELTTAVSGALFGAALMSAGVYSPHIIIGQMKLENFHMLKAFLAASASSAIAIYLVRRYSSQNICKPKTPSTLGQLGPYDGNVIGGAMLGVGMALTGACPGTLLPQLAIGVPSGKYVLTGGLLGGILYARLVDHFYGPWSRSQKEKLKESIAITQPTIYQRVGESEEVGVAAYVAMCSTVIASAIYLFPEQGRVLLPAAVGGLFIGLSQATSLALTGSTLGVSLAYEQFGHLFWWAFSEKKKPVPNYKGLAFPIGSIIGAFILSRLVSIPAPAAVDVGPMKALIGGVLLVFGGRIGGGCTSGHGISGMSMLSISSVVSVASMFGTGILVGKLFG